MQHPYNMKSECADEFINHEEILRTLEYAEANKNNLELCREILNIARAHTHISAVDASARTDHPAALTHVQAALLLACEDPEINAEIFKLADEIKQAYYGNRIVLFAPLYLSNYCVNSCAYCPYHAQNKTIPRKKLTQAQIEEEVRALISTGHKRLAIEAGEDPKNNPLEYIMQSIETIYSTKVECAQKTVSTHSAENQQESTQTSSTPVEYVPVSSALSSTSSPAPKYTAQIRRVNVNIAATTEREYAQLKHANIGTYILFQETYNKAAYEQLHPRGPKSDYNYHTQAHDRAMSAGIDDVGLGVLFGLDTYAYEFCGLIMHAEHLEATFGTGPHTISVPRVKPAVDIDPNTFAGNRGLSDEMFEKIIALIRLTVPYTGIIISTRESDGVRARALACGVSQISGGSRTSVGGYVEVVRPHDTEQFSVSDSRSLDEVIGWLMRTGHIPSFCTACYGLGRTGDRFMQFCKSGQILNYCHPNALVTLAEYLAYHATSETRAQGLEMLKSEFSKIKSPDVRKKCENYIQQIFDGEGCGFRF